MHVTILSVMSTTPGIELLPAPRQTTPLVIGLLAVFATALAAIAALAFRAGDDKPTTVVANPQVVAAVDNIDYFVGTNLAVGIYRQAVATSSCSYRISDPITDELIEVSAPGSTGPITVNLGKDVKFRSAGCGAWTPAS